MKPTVRLAASKNSAGAELALYRHEDDFSIRVDGRVLMNSRQHESEVQLAQLGCTHLEGQPGGAVLIGGLGLGYSLRACLDLVGPQASVVICELMPEVITWNRDFLGELTGHPLRDPRVRTEACDIVSLLSKNRGQFDAILLDIDNGPNAMSDPGNRRLYGRAGIDSCRRALRAGGRLAVWSVEPDKVYEQALMKAGLDVRRYRVPAYKGSKAQSRFIFLAATPGHAFPPGGGKPAVETPRRRPPPRRGRRR